MRARPDRRHDAKAIAWRSEGTRMSAASLLSVESLAMLAGVHQPDSGHILWEGEPVALTSPRRALAIGIGTVFQERSLVVALSVAENIYAGCWPCPGVRRLAQTS